VFALIGLYNSEIYERRFPEFGRLLTGCMIGMLGIISFDYFYSQPLFPARLVPVYALLLSFGLIFFERALLRQIRKTLFSYNVGINNVLIIGSSPATKEIAEYLGDTRYSGYRISGVFGKRELIPARMNATHFVSLDTALSALKNIHTIVQTELYEDEKVNQKILESARDNHIAYKFIPTNPMLYTGNNRIELFHNFPVIAVHQTALMGWGRIGKRAFDIFGAIIGLIVSVPIFLVVGAVIKLTDPKGPIFFKHKRISRFGTKFEAYKLRSMYWKYSTKAGSKKSEVDIFKEMGRDDLIKEWHLTHKVKKDPRIMPVGRFTRKTSIDELPQLLNVLRGELSLIGPRPVTKEELERYKQASSLFLSVKPGITGLWQVSGRNEVSYDERIELDLYYVQHWSFLLDMKIMYRTILVMIGGKGH
jgi:exopolysaccharide biosynthesis polyprenyl glycosylphosphotransferase